ncbi:MAG: hypothetical protein OXB88_00005 [Bacteriovoracales bacterium]|nr:hypothetical protein [Bacteriovoracales bacterium]
MNAAIMTMIGCLAFGPFSFSAHASPVEEITFTIPSSSPESSACESAEDFTWGLSSILERVTLNDVTCSKRGNKLDVVLTVVRGNPSPTPLMEAHTYTLNSHIQGEMIRGSILTLFGKDILKKMNATGKCLFTYRISPYDRSIITCE